MTKDYIFIRQFKEDESSEIGFIYGTWLNSLYGLSPLYSHMPKSLFMKYYHDIIDSYLGENNIRINIASLKEDENVIVGYAVFKNEILHYVYVKEAWQKLGIANMLVPSDIKVVTELTSVGISILKRHRKLIYNPFYERGVPTYV